MKKVLKYIFTTNIKQILDDVREFYKLDAQCHDAANVRDSALRRITSCQVPRRNKRNTVCVLEYPTLRLDIEGERTAQTKTVKCDLFDEGCENSQCDCHNKYQAYANANAVYAGLKNKYDNYWANKFAKQK